MGVCKLILQTHPETRHPAFARRTGRANAGCNSARLRIRQHIAKGWASANLAPVAASIAFPAARCSRARLTTTPSKTAKEVKRTIREGSDYWNQRRRRRMAACILRWAKRGDRDSKHDHHGHKTRHPGFPWQCDRELRPPTNWRDARSTGRSKCRLKARTSADHVVNHRERMGCKPVQRGLGPAAPAGAGICSVFLGSRGSHRLATDCRCYAAIGVSPGVRRR